MQNGFLKDRKGQTLIEAIIAIAIGTIIVAAILGLAARSNRNANFAKSQEQASDLAQQGLEIIRNIEDVNAEGYILNVGPPTPGFSCNPSCSWSELYQENVQDTANANNGNFILVPSGTGTCGNASWCLSYNTASFEAIASADGNFTRAINISDTPSSYNTCNSVELDHMDIKQVIVIVRWEDPTGSHENLLSSCIASL